MKHIALAVVAAAALAVIGPRMSQENPQPKETAAHHDISVPSGYRATPPRHTEPIREFPNTPNKPY